ncbi:1,4-alpha-glucan branching protein GlgB [Holophaga foetida]|uniref:1,4-alpha-glucan branching protein GlgB n=1 Tax=Holophaga foetida TaxID=35839 RepID=UPI00024749D3|nr:1,4-alpha-glucan branching protein GlgB [Holophaga foetida]
MPKSKSLNEDLRKLLEARHHDPFRVLGRHGSGAEAVIRAFLPRTESAHLADTGQPLTRIEGTDLFMWKGLAGGLKPHHELCWVEDGVERRVYDPYTFGPQLSDFDLHLFREGKHWHAYRLLGAREHLADGIPGVLFSVWAPNAERVSVVGDFNHWDGRCHPMRVHPGHGVWELFIPGLGPGTLYKFEVRNRDTGAILLKTDPYGRAYELRPSTASCVEDASPYPWQDADWMEGRKHRDWQHAPMSVYEVHLGSWQRTDDGGFLNYRELAHKLADYAVWMGFTHLEFLPVTEFPFDGSWGYQATGYYAPTSRHGSPEDFRYLVDHCHSRGIGVIVDWVPAHFPKDRHALAQFDGTALYEHADPRLGEHMDWSTLIFNFGRNEVKNFLLSSALFWLEEMHIDGLRVDAVASMLYLDYSRKEGEWLPNRYGGRENLEAIDFLKEMNVVLHDQCPGALVIAEESTSWPQVSRPTYLGGLGFDLKWNMGWMNDTLRYMKLDPVYRAYSQDFLTFSMLYAFTENFMLPFSHDEVVHGKASMLYKMPGDEWQRFANLRALYAYMFAHPGKKLLFMGTEFGQGPEWNADRALDWYVLDYPLHRGLQLLVRDLNHLHQEEPALHGQDFEWPGFEWIDCHDTSQSVLSFVRRSGNSFVVVIVNFTPVPRHDYRIGVPAPGCYSEILNSDAHIYGGGDVGNGDRKLLTEEHPWMGRPWSLALTLPPLGVLILRLSAEEALP